MTTNDFQIIGKGGAAREIAAFIPGRKWFFTSDEIESILPHVPTIIAIGEPSVRKRIAEKWHNLKYGVFKASSAMEWGTVYLGEGTMICSSVEITTNVYIGKHCLINVGSKIHHDCVIEDFVTIGPSVTVCGNVKIKNLCYIGAGATIIERVSICEGVTIGAGAVVVEDITEPGTYVGVPAKKINKPYITEI